MNDIFNPSAWGFRGKRVRVVGLAACCNYFSKKKKNFSIVYIDDELIFSNSIKQHWHHWKN